VGVMCVEVEFLYLGLFTMYYGPMATSISQTWAFYSDQIALNNKNQIERKLSGPFKLGKIAFCTSRASTPLNNKNQIEEK
jgi:hypothetical protein